MRIGEVLLGLVTACAIAGAAIVIHQRVTAYRGGAPLTLGGVGQTVSNLPLKPASSITLTFGRSTSGNLVLCDTQSSCISGDEIIVYGAGGAGGGSGGGAGGKTAPGTVITTYPDHEKTP